MTPKRKTWLPRPRVATVLELVRGGYGAIEFAVPGLVVNHVLHGRADSRARIVARVLGGRQLVQAVASGTLPSYPMLALSVEVDLLHASSMVALALTDRRRRKEALRDAFIAASFGAVGVLAACIHADKHQMPPATKTRSLVEGCTERLAGVFVPRYTTPPWASR